MSAVRIYVADDHPIVVEGLRRFFSTVPEVEWVGACGDAAALFELEPGTVDVLVLDVRMPGMHGTETLRALATRVPAILLFTLEPESALVVELLRAGASGVVGKSERVDNLLSAICAAAAGERVVSAELESRLRSDAATWPHESLSPREHAIFMRLIHGASPKEVAFDLGLSASTVYTYAERVRQKLGVQGSVELVAYAHRAGLLQH